MNTNMQQHEDNAQK